MRSGQPSRPNASLLPKPTVSPLLARTVFALFAALLIQKTAQFSGLITLDKVKVLTDFDALHIAGRMVWQGRIDQAYHFESMLRAQIELSGGRGFLPWAYPPQFDLVVAALALLPLGPSYLVFTGGTLLAYLFVLRRIAGPHFAVVTLAIFPAIAVVIACGQNGFMTGALIGWACLALLRERASAGLPLGLMIIKPHLAVAFAVYAVATRRWAVVAIAAAMVLGSGVLATSALGPQIWMSFLHGMSEARFFLEQGLYPLFRMISPFAALRSVGAPAWLALAAQGVSAALALAMVATAIRRRSERRQVLGVTALASLLVSPYAYDYDLPMLGIAAALLMPDLVRLMSLRERKLLLGLCAVTTGWGLAMTTILKFLPESEKDVFELVPCLAPAIAGATLPITALLVWRVLRRDQPSRRPLVAMAKPAVLA